MKSTLNGDALTTADNLMTKRYKTIAQSTGFTPHSAQAHFGINGSGMHTNMSLVKGGKMPSR